MDMEDHSLTLKTTNMKNFYILNSKYPAKFIQGMLKHRSMTNLRQSQLQHLLHCLDIVELKSFQVG